MYIFPRSQKTCLCSVRAGERLIRGRVSRYVRVRRVVKRLNLRREKYVIHAKCFTSLKRRGDSPSESPVIIITSSYCARVKFVNVPTADAAAHYVRGGMNRLAFAFYFFPFVSPIRVLEHVPIYNIPDEN